MFILLYSLLFIVAIILQLTIIPLFSVKGITPDLVFILVMSIVFKHGRFWGLVSGFFAGLFLDFFGTGFVGISSLANIVAVFFAGYWVNAQLERRFGLTLLFLFITILIHNLIYFPILSIGSAVGFWPLLFRNVIPHSVYTLVFMAVIYLTVPRAFNKKRLAY